MDSGELGRLGTASASHAVRAQAVMGSGALFRIRAERADRVEVTALGTRHRLGMASAGPERDGGDRG